jgi:hypothetical protein
VAELAQGSLVDSLCKLNGQAERMAAVMQFDRFIGEAKEAWRFIHGIYGDMQRLLTAFVFERKSDDGPENEDWDETQKMEPTGTPEDEEDEADYTGGTGDTSSG